MPYRTVIICFDDACQTVADAESTGICVFSTGVAPVEDICLRNTCVWHVGTEIFDARVTKRADFRDL